MIDVQVDASDVLAGMQNILDNGQNLPMDEIAQILIESVQRNFEEEGRPDKWEARKNYGDGHPLLNDTGNLINSLETQVTGDIAAVICGADYGKYHNEGTGRIPQREFLIVQEQDMDAIEDLLAKHFS